LTFSQLTLLLLNSSQIDKYKAKGALKEIGIAKVRLLSPEIIHGLMATM